MQAVVFSDGVLFLDDCDFSESNAATLVSSGNNATTVIRNAVLGNENCESSDVICRLFSYACSFIVETLCREV